MPSVRVNKELNDQVYFVTMTIRHWYHLFDRYDRWEILTDSLIHCQEHKGLKIYAYIFMLNHIHLIIQAPDVSGVIRDFKSYTAKALLKNIKETELDILNLFCFPDGHYELWQKTNMPELIETEQFLEQKFNYIHYNPVEKQYVAQPEHWLWSSAGYYATGEQGRIKIDYLE